MGKKSPTSKQNTLTSATQTTVKSQNQIVAELTARIANLEKTLERLQIELAITKNVNDILTNQVDDLHQYQRRQCIVINGCLQTSPSETILKVIQKTENVLAQHLKLDTDEIVNQIDKCHCIGPLKDDGTQSTIVRFKLHSFREAYVNRKKCTNRNIKIKLSLTRERKKH